MTKAMIEVIHALAIRPELLTIAVLAVVIALMMKRRLGLTAAKAKNGSPVFKLVINRLTWVMFLLVGAAIIREIAVGVVAGIKAMPPAP